jgi:hypothetical protein
MPNALWQLNWHFASSFYQGAKQTPSEKIRFGHPFGMPLNAGDPVGIPRPFDGFDHSIRCPSGDAEGSAGIEDRLMMGAIDPNFVRARQFPQTRAGFNSCSMKRLWSAFVAV